MAPVRVLVVDDHAMVAEGLAEILAADAGIEVVGCAGTARDAERMASQFVPDVVVMDYRLPDRDGLSATRTIRRANPGIAVIMVTSSDHATVVAESVEAGCSAYITKDRAARDVVAAVHAAAHGEMTFPASVLTSVLSRGRAGSVALTPREREVLEQLAQGRSTAEIAERFVVSPSTVRNHVQSLLVKLGAHSRLEAVSIATRQGLVAFRG